MCQARPFLPVRVSWPGGPGRKKPSAWPESLGQGTWGHSSVRSPASLWLGATPALALLHPRAFHSPPLGWAVPRASSRPSSGLCPWAAQGPGALAWPTLAFGPLPPPLPFDGAPRGPSRTPRLSCTGTCWVHRPLPREGQASTRQLPAAAPPLGPDPAGGPGAGGQAACLSSQPLL